MDVQLDEVTAHTVGELWVHIVLDIEVLYKARAWAADVMYRALKTEAGMNNITFCDIT